VTVALPQQVSDLQRPGDLQRQTHAPIVHYVAQPPQRYTGAIRAQRAGRLAYAAYSVSPMKAAHRSA
jgi:hypothetical protein